MSHVFLSHGSEDRAEATALCAFIEERGVTVWMAPRDVRPGTDYSEELQRSIETCDAFIVLVTDTANKSPYVRAETEMAFSSHKPIFPVRLADVKPAAGLAFFLKIRHWTDAFGAVRDANLDGLARELRTLSGIAPAAPAEPSPPPVPAPAAQPVPPAPTPPEPLPDEDRLAAAIGPKAAWYLERWQRADAKKSAVSWNWPACLASFYWFAYRKMWLGLAIVAAAFVVLSAIGTVEPRLAQVTFLASIAITFVTGTFGNHWYRKRVSALAADSALDLEALRRRGGVSVPAVWGAVAGTLVLVMISAAFTVKQLPPQPVPPAPSPPPPPAVDYGPPAAPVLDRAYLIGRWSDSGDCSQAFEFTADGRFIAADGGSGEWRLDGDQLTASGPGGSVTMRVAPIDQNTMTVTNADGQSSNPIRCVS